MSTIWKPSVTVAAMIFNGTHFLRVEEETPDGIRFNQPAGHVEVNESLLQAVIRETMEETAYDFTPTVLVGTYLSRSVSRYVLPKTGGEVTYLRCAFAGELGQRFDQELDEGILRTVWMTQTELELTRDTRQASRSAGAAMCG